MSNLRKTDDLFFKRTGLDREKTEKLVANALKGSDDGELYMEYCQSEGISLDDGNIRSASFDTAQGFGLRAISGETIGFAHASDLSEDAMKRAAETVQAVRSGKGGTMAEPPAGTNRSLYTDENPLGAFSFEDKVKLLGEIDAYARSKDPLIKQVSASIAGEWQAVQIIRGDGKRVADIRPLVRLNVSVVVGKGDRMESGSYGAGGRVGFAAFVEPDAWQYQVDEASAPGAGQSGIGSRTGGRNGCGAGSRLAGNPAA